MFGFMLSQENNINGYQKKVEESEKSVSHTEKEIDRETE